MSEALAQMVATLTGSDTDHIAPPERVLRLTVSVADFERIASGTITRIRRPVGPVSNRMLLNRTYSHAVITTHAEDRRTVHPVTGIGKSRKYVGKREDGTSNYRWFWEISL